MYSDLLVVIECPVTTPVGTDEDSALPAPTDPLSISSILRWQWHRKHSRRFLAISPDSPQTKDNVVFAKIDPNLICFSDEVLMRPLLL